MKHVEGDEIWDFHYCRDNFGDKQEDQRQNACRRNQILETMREVKKIDKMRNEEIWNRIMSVRSDMIT